MSANQTVVRDLNADVAHSLGFKHIYHRYTALSSTEQPAKAGTCAHDRRALQQLVLNVHVKHSDLTRYTAFYFSLNLLYLNTGAKNLLLRKHNICGGVIL